MGAHPFVKRMGPYHIKTSKASSPKDKSIATCLSALGWDGLPDDQHPANNLIDIDEAKRVTLGEWGRMARADK